jgi:hypothetical protein
LTFTGTAQIVRSDGATLTGTLTGQGDCTDQFGISSVDASYTLKLTVGTGELVSATFDNRNFVRCSWAQHTTVSGTPSPETCSGIANVVVSKVIGYAIVNDRGGVSVFGGLSNPEFPIDYAFRTPAPTPMKLAITPSRKGSWLVNGAGHVYVHGDAKWFGNAPPLRASEVVRGIAATPTGSGYWLATSRGRVLAFGAARFFGDVHSITLNKPIVDLAATPDGHGYWMVASDGGVFGFGSARFFGSTGSIRLSQPIVGFAPTRDGHGYWLGAADGGIFGFGDAKFRGSMASAHLNAPISAITRYGQGYLLVGSDGGIFNFGTDPFFGSDELANGGLEPSTAIVGVD